MQWLRSTYCLKHASKQISIICPIKIKHWKTSLHYRVMYLHKIKFYYNCFFINAIKRERERETKQKGKKWKWYEHFQTNTAVHSD